MPKILISLIIFILILVGAKFFWAPKYQTIKDLKTKLKQDKIQLQNKENFFADLRNLAKKLKNYNVQLSNIETILPDDPLISDLFNYFTKEVSQNGLILKNIKWNKTFLLDPKTGIKKTSFDLVLSGSYSAFKNFLFNLHQSARLFELGSISFTSEEEGGGFNFNLTVETFSY